MQRIDNPYSPGAGRKPAALVGRDEPIEMWETDLIRIEHGLDARPMTLYGLRGIGKTVLLSRLQEIAQDRNWISARFEATRQKSLREMISLELENKLVEIARPGVGKKTLHALKTALSFRTSIGLPGVLSFGIDLSDARGSNANTGNLSGDIYRLMKDLSEATEESGAGIALLIDEAQDLSSTDLATICEVTHNATQDGLRLVVALAGLPTLPGLLAKAKSYAERLFAYRELLPLTIADAKNALVTPSDREGVEWEEDAVELIVSVSAGYPYFIQEYGSECWLKAMSSPITYADAKEAIITARVQLDEGFFKARWDRISESQKEYLRAMAEDNDDISMVRDIAKRLNTTTTAISQRRSDLIGKGLIFAPKNGVVSFSVPLMADFINRQSE
jgi:hypothetical protein